MKSQNDFSHYRKAGEANGGYADFLSGGSPSAKVRTQMRYGMHFSGLPLNHSILGSFKGVCGHTKVPTIADSREGLKIEIRLMFTYLCFAC